MILRSIDMHAHIDPTIGSADLDALGALVFAATRTLDEAEQALRRTDTWTIWGVGCHPGLVGAQRAFDCDRFAGLIERTAYVGELGLDGKSRVPLDLQAQTLNTALTVLKQQSRLVSLHSYAATGELLAALKATPIEGAVLHWWLGDPAQTLEALELGCYFSINAAMTKRRDILALLPQNRVLTETDHPFGDRSAGRGRRPGNVATVEHALADMHGHDVDGVRRQLWRNLATLVSASDTAGFLPRHIRLALAAAV